MNEHDSEIIGGLLTAQNYELAENEHDAEVIIVNTCCVRESAENRIKGYIGSLKSYKEQGMLKVLAVCGCMTQQQTVSELLRKSYRHVDIILGTYAQHRLPEYIEKIMAGAEPIIDILQNSADMPDTLPTRRDDSIKAQVNIIYGCNNFCSYCIVPYVRNEERSRSVDAILDECRSLAQQGYQEIMLLGQNVNSYGKDLPEGLDFADLLQQVVQAAPQIPRIRYMTSHPRDFNTKLVDTVAELPQVCNQFHLPIQSGCDKVLLEMNRGYTAEEYWHKLQYLRSKLPDATVTTDLIVGFPGETEEDFAQTLEFIKRCHFDAAYTFLYSQRSGTPAAQRDDQVPLSVKKERLQRLMDVQNIISLEINRQMVGRIYDVLVEGVSKTSDKLTGRTDGNKIVTFSAPNELIGKIIPVQITAANTWSLSGKVL